VVQEVLLAKSDPIVLCGSRSLPFDVSIAGCQVLHMSDMSERECWETRKCRVQFDRLVSLRKRYTEAVSFTDLLAHTKDFDVTDARDKIYGCLGLLQRAAREVLKPE
jgi:hypothetical protein